MKVSAHLSCLDRVLSAPEHGSLLRWHLKWCPISPLCATSVLKKESRLNISTVDAWMFLKLFFPELKTCISRYMRSPREIEVSFLLEDYIVAHCLNYPLPN
jgi:hypothetical protein